MQFKRLFQFLIIVSLLFTIGGSPPQQGSAAKAQPQLVQMAAQDPDQMVRVIAQKMAGSQDAESQVIKLGGTVTKELNIINAFAAEMTAEAAVELARAEAVRWVSLDAMMASAACTQCIDTTKLANTYIRTIRADQVWNNSKYLQGQGIGVAVVDSGINPNGDFYTNTGVNRQVIDVRFNSDYNQTTTDGYGHGTHVASIVGADGSESGGKHIGVAPMVKIINVKVSNDNGYLRTRTNTTFASSICRSIVQWQNRIIQALWMQR
jgi:serine protease AprX